VKYKSQEEAWFDAEITIFLDGQEVNLKREESYLSDRDLKTGKLIKRYSDFRLHLDYGEHLMEMKAFLNKPNKSRIKEVYDRLTTCPQSQK
jgi:hypothetical protein